MTHEQFQDWKQAYGANPWGEERADARQHILIEHTLSPYVKHRFQPLPNIMWPYYDNQFGGHSPAELLAFMQAFDECAVPNDGGGYTLTKSMAELVEAANGS